VWSRKHYRGAYAADIWILDVAAKTYSSSRLGDPAYRGNSLWPMYGADGYIYFVADITANEKTIKNNSPEVMKSVNNIWKVPEKGGMPIQVTKHADGNLFFPSISADRKTIVYEDNFGIWKLETATGKASEIRIEIKSDSKTNDTELVTMSKWCSDWRIGWVLSGSRRATIGSILLHSPTTAILCSSSSKACAGLRVPAVARPSMYAAKRLSCGPGAERRDPTKQFYIRMFFM
jgi:tricorn protease-like protein